MLRGWFRFCGPLSDRDPILVPVTQICERRSTEARKAGRLLGVTLDDVVKPDPGGTVMILGTPVVLS
jgi:hypothetical protein